MADKILTFEYAYANYDAYKKRPIPNTKECMTRLDLDTYICNDSKTPGSQLYNYANNRLVPIAKVGLNDAPVSNNKSISLANREGIEINPTTFFTYSDPNADNITHIRFIPLTGSGQLKVGIPTGPSIVPCQEYSIDTLFYYTAPDEDTQETTEFEFSVRDVNGCWSDECTMPL